MHKKDIVVIGTSAGGFEVLKTIISGLPRDFTASIFIVWHMAPDMTGILPEVLNKYGLLFAANAKDGEMIVPGRIYVAPPDHHLLIENGYIRLSHGPKENRFRPAVDPLFRSAAYHYSNRVVGVVLSGGMDDGSSGILAIKQAGGMAVVQDPGEAEVSSMPEHALAAVKADYCLPGNEIAACLVRLSGEKITPMLMKDDQVKTEIDIAAGVDGTALQFFKTGNFSPYTCPECGGVLAQFKENGGFRFRCHTGHAFSADSLLLEVNEHIEASFYKAMRSVEESMMLLNQLGDHYAEDNEPKLAAVYFNKATDLEKQVQVVRQVVQSVGQLSIQDLKNYARVSSENSGA